MDLQITNTHRGVLDWIASLLGGRVSSTERKVPHQRRKFEWSIFDAIKIREILVGMRPFLKIKADQCDVAFKFLDTVRSRPKNKPTLLTKKELLERNRCALALRRSRWKEWKPIKVVRAIKKCRCGKRFRPVSDSHIHCSNKCNQKLRMREIRAALRVR